MKAKKCLRRRLIKIWYLEVFGLKKYKSGTGCWKFNIAVIIAE